MNEVQQWQSHKWLMTFGTTYVVFAVGLSLIIVGVLWFILTMAGAAPLQMKRACIGFEISLLVLIAFGFFYLF
jgi:hypothetical protein